MSTIVDPRSRSIFASLHPATRLLGAAALAVVICLCTTFTAVLTGFVIAFISLLLSRQQSTSVVRRLGEVNILVVVMIVILPITAPGSPALAIGPISFSRDGLQLAAMIALKANAVMIAFLALIAALGPTALASGLRSLGLPATLVHTLTFMVRSISLIGDEHHRLRLAMRCRGFVPGVSRHAFATYGTLVGQLLLRSIDRAERIDAAMRCRGFDGRLPRSVAPVFTRLDLLFTVLVTALLVGLGWIEWITRH
jgi:cobalt/nickel transport system permease protein